MNKRIKTTGLTRREFVKTMGLAGLAAGTGAASAMAAEPQAGAAKAATVPQRKLGKTGVDVSILTLGGMFDTINNQLLLKQARNWGVTYWDTAESYGNGLSEEGFGRYFSRNPGTREEIFLVTKLVPKKGKLTERLEKSLKRLKTDHVDLFFIHAICGIDEMTPAFKEWAAQMKKAGKFKFFGFSTHTNMEGCLAGAAKMDWIDAIMMTYNFRLMHKPKMQEAVNACVKAGIGLVAMKTQGGGPVTCDSEAEMKMAGRFLEKGFTDKQARLKAVWENPNIASICSQMPNLTILGANVAAARDLTKLTRGDFHSMEEYARETACGYCAGCGHICMAALDGAVPVNDVMRCLMYHHDYGEPDLARTTFATLPADVRQRLAKLDYTRAEQVCPQGLAIGALMRQATEVLA